MKTVLFTLGLLTLLCFPSNGQPVRPPGQTPLRGDINGAGFSLTNLGNVVSLTLDTGQGANELYDMNQDVMTTSSPSFGSLTVTTNMAVGGVPIAGRLMTLRRDNLTTLPVDGLFFTNATPASVGAQQYSPSIYWSGNAWDTDGSSQPVIFRSYVVPVQGTTPSATWTLDSSINNGAFGTPFTFTSGGAFSSPSTIAAAAAGSIGFTGRSLIFSLVNGELVARNNGQSAISTFQLNQPQVTKTANYTNIVALDSGIRYSNIGASIAITNVLPTAVALQHYWFYVDAAQIYSIKSAGSDVIRWGSTVSGAAGDIWSSQVGSALHLFSPKAGLWVVDSAQGAWTLLAPRAGNATLVAGTVTVNNATVTSNTIVLVSRKTDGGTIGTSFNYTTSAGVSFTINAIATDTSTVSWSLEEIPN